MLETIEFLDLIWGEEDCYIDLPSKAGGHWIPWIAEWPTDRVLVGSRILSCLEDEEDIYFSAARFSGKGRRLTDVLPTRWLWADLDRTDPVFFDSDYLLPTVAWESSPGRYQCMWQLTRELKPELQTKLNQRLNYAVGADRGGWGLTKVLRPVGTRNFKYDPIADVELMWYDLDMVYDPKEVRDAVIRIEEEEADAETRVARSARDRQAGSGTESSARRIPGRARVLLRTPEEMVQVGERSERLWEMEKLLAEAGFPEDEIFDLVWPSAWNKHKEVNTGEDRLHREIAKVVAETPVTRVPSRPAPDVDTDEWEEDADQREPRRKHRVARPRVTSPFVDYATFLSTNIETPRWLIEDIWSAASHGIVGGEPKTSKSSLVMAMALSVATGKPFLNKYPVASQGPVLMIQEENAPWVVQDRLRKLANMYGLLGKKDVEISAAPAGSIADHIVRLNFPDEAPLRLLNNYGFDLTDEKDLSLLENEVRKTGAAMVVIDPLYLTMPGVNLSQSHEVGPLLQWLMALRHNYNCAVVLVHHWSKANDNSKLRRAGQRLLGTGFFHGWLESGLYLEKLEGDVLRVKIEREFRNVAPMGDLEVAWHMGDAGELDMSVDVSGFDEGEHMDIRIDELIRGLLPQHPDGLNLKHVALALGNNHTPSRELKQEVALAAKRLGWKVTRKQWGQGPAYIIYPNDARRKEKK